MAPFVRPFLAVSQTTLGNPETGERYTFNGLFTTRSVPTGGFLGFYNGKMTDHGTKRAVRGGRYTFSTSSLTIRPPSGKGGIVDVYRYPLAMANEPLPGTVSNACVVELTQAKENIPQLPGKTSIEALGFFATRPIPAGEEIFIHYGKDYDRSHYANPSSLPSLSLVGKASSVKKTDRETPERMMIEFGLHPFVDRECFVELE